MLSFMLASIFEKETFGDTINKYDRIKTIEWRLECS